MKTYSDSFIKLFDEEDPQWLALLPSLIETICKNENFTIESVFQNSRFGFVAKGNQDAHQRVLKIVDTKFEKYRGEIEAAKMLNYSFCNKVYSSSVNQGYYISDYCESIQNNQGNWFDILKPIFQIAKQERQKYTGQNTLLQIYEKKIINRQFFMYSEHNEDEFSGLLNYIDTALKIYENTFSLDDLYLLHGDLHEKNIMLKGNHFVSIDPLGIIAPFEFEYTRFIENQIFCIQNEKAFIELVNYYLCSFELIGISKEKLLSALYIDSVVRTSSTVKIKDDYSIFLMGLNNAKILKNMLLEI